MHRRWALLTTCLFGCVDLRTAPIVGSEEATTPAAPTPTEPNQVGSPADDAAAPASETMESLRRKLAALAWRIADEPVQLRGAGSTVFWSDTNHLHALHAHDNDRVDFGFTLDRQWSANDAFVVVRRGVGTFEAYAARAAHQLVATLEIPTGAPDAIATPSGIAIVQSGPRSTVHLWHPPAPWGEAPKATFDTLVSLLAGNGPYLFFERITPVGLARADLESGTAHTWPSAERVLSARQIASGTVMSRLVQSSLQFDWIGPDDLVSSLGERVARASGPFAGAERNPISPEFVAYRNWMIYSYRSGIAAFDVEHDRWVPVQLHASSPTTIIHRIAVLEDAGLLAFAQRGAGAGLYLLRLGDVLPP